MLEPGQDLLEAEHLDARRRELESQRQVVEPAADLRHDRGRLEVRIDDARSRAEEADGLLRHERRHRVLLLGGDPERLAARHEDPQPAATRQQIGEVGRHVEELLEIVQKEQELLLRDVVGELLRRAEHLGDRVEHERRIADGARRIHQTPPGNAPPTPRRP